MSNTIALAPPNQSLAKIEAVLIRGDLSRLSDEERVSYYRALCEHVGLDPITQPFEFLTLQGKLILYAKKSAAEGLRKVHKISIAITSRQQIGEIYQVCSAAKLPDGRSDEDVGTVFLGKLQGNDLANAMLKCETKAKRRVTLSICGLGMLDETEVEDIPPKEKNGLPLIYPDQPWAGDGSTESVGYRISFGQWKGRSIEDVYNNFGPQKMANYIEYLEVSAKKKGQPLGALALEFVEMASAYLGAMENAAVEEMKS